MTHFEYETTMPAEAKAAIEDQLKSLEWLVPGWVQKVNVWWCDDANNESAKEGAAISAYCDYTYRRLSLTFFPCWLASDASHRREMCIHDMLHAFTGVLADFCRDEIKRLIPEDDSPKYRGVLLDELERRHEQMTQDLAFCLAQHVK